MSVFVEENKVFVESPLVIQETSAGRSSATFRRKVAYAILILLVLLGGWIFFGAPGASSEESAREEVEALVQEVGALIELPKDEQPTVATVTDPAFLKGQEFFKNALVGDKVLIYPVARKALLYSPSKRKLIEVVPISNEGEPGKI